MRALIFSDSHRNVKVMTDVIEKYKDVGLIIHAGDVAEDAFFLAGNLKNKNVVFVKGNNDYRHFDLPSERVFDFCGKRIFLTHGHKYGVKMNLYSVLAAAREKEADICIFGHTHSRFMECVDGVWLFNPGSAVNGAGLLEVSDNEIKLLFLSK